MKKRTKQAIGASATYMAAQGIRGYHKAAPVARSMGMNKADTRLVGANAALGHMNRATKGAIAVGVGYYAGHKATAEVKRRIEHNRRRPVRR